MQCCCNQIVGHLSILSNCVLSIHKVILQDCSHYCNRGPYSWYMFWCDLTCCVCSSYLKQLTGRSGRIMKLVWNKELLRRTRCMDTGQRATTKRYIVTNCSSCFYIGTRIALLNLWPLFTEVNSVIGSSLMPQYH